MIVRRISWLYWTILGTTLLGEYPNNIQELNKHKGELYFDSSHILDWCRSSHNAPKNSLEEEEVFSRIVKRQLSQQSYWRNTYPKRENLVPCVNENICCTMHNSTSSIYQGKQHSGSWRVCSGCLEMFIASSLDVKHSDLFMSHDTEKVAPVLVQWFRLL